VNSFNLIGQNRADAERASAFKVTQKLSGVSCGLVVVDADKDPSGRPIDDHKAVAALPFILHLQQLLHVHMKIAGLIHFEGAVLWLGSLGSSVKYFSYFGFQATVPWVCFW